MELSDLIVLFTYILAISGASERLITLVKTFVPWLSEEPVSAKEALNPDQLRYKSIATQALTIICALITSYFANHFKLQPALPNFNFDKATILIGFLASGGSTFWTTLLGYTTALRDIKKTEAKQRKIELSVQAKGLHSKGTLFSEY